MSGNLDRVVHAQMRVAELRKTRHMGPFYTQIKDLEPTRSVWLIYPYNFSNVLFIDLIFFTIVAV